MIRTSDNAPMHSKFQQAGLLAYGWWHAALSYCGREMTDGFIAARNFALVFPTATAEEVRAAVAALTREGSLHHVEAGEQSPCGRRRGTCPATKAPATGVILHDYFDYQERARSARLRRRDLSTYGRQGGKKSGEVRQAKASSQSEAEAVLLSVPIRSVPIRSVPEAVTALSGAPDLGNGHHGDAKEIIAFLNAKTGRSYRLSPTNVRLIEARLKSGASVQDCKSIIARKVRAWLTDPKMVVYLRPETLFNATKFESYLGELGS